MKSVTPVSGIQRSYAHFLRGRGRYSSRDVKVKLRAKADYLTAQKLAPRAEWSGEALFLAANAAFNLERRTAEAVGLWNRLIEEYPKHREAPRAAYYVGIAYETAGEFSLAKRAFERSKRLFPRSPAKRLVEEHLKSVERKLASPR